MEKNDNISTVDYVLKMEWKNKKYFSIYNAKEINYWHSIILKDNLCELYLQRKPLIEKEMRLKDLHKRKIYRNKL